MPPMNRIQVTIQSVAAQSGVEYVCVAAQPGQTPTLTGSAGDPTYDRVVAVALGFFDLDPAVELRVVLGKKTITLRRDDVARAAMVAETGHPIAKSGQRLLRKLVRRAGQGARVSTVTPEPRAELEAMPAAARTPDPADFFATGVG